MSLNICEGSFKLRLSDDLTEMPTTQWLAIIRVNFEAIFQMRINDSVIFLFLESFSRPCDRIT